MLGDRWPLAITRRDLEPLIARPLFIPGEGAHDAPRRPLRDDGTLLEFDPFSRACIAARVAASTFDDDALPLVVMGYQLWLAERAVHAPRCIALPWRRTHRDFARCGARGLRRSLSDYPNRRQRLGPTRVFFSTYLESIWLLQFDRRAGPAARFDAGRQASTLGARVLERSFDRAQRSSRATTKGLSNRQVWNNAALLAAARSLGGANVRQRCDGRRARRRTSRAGCFADGTWYEGENYHLFAHRGLWYGVMIARRRVSSCVQLLDRFDEAFAHPFRQRAAGLHLSVAPRLSVRRVARGSGASRAGRAGTRQAARMNGLTRCACDVVRQHTRATTPAVRARPRRLSGTRRRTR
jgi:hypothetical protein